MKNTYGYAVFKSALNTPLHVVEIHSNMTAGVYVYSTPAAAQGRCNTARFCLNCKYDPDFEFTPGILKEYTTAQRLYSRRDNMQVYIAYDAEVAAGGLQRVQNTLL